MVNYCKTTITKEEWLRVLVRKAGPGKPQLEITVPSKVVKELDLKRGDYLWVSFSREAP